MGRTGRATEAGAMALGALGNYGVDLAANQLLNATGAADWAKRYGLYSDTSGHGLLASVRSGALFGAFMAGPISIFPMRRPGM